MAGGMQDFAGKVAMVTGAGSGIGEAIARELARRGATVAVVDINRSQGGRVAESLTDYSPQSAFFEADVSSSGSVNRAVDAIAGQLGGIDILVNNAGIVVQKLVVDLEDADWRRLLGVNLDGVFFCSRAAASKMVAQGRGGKIVNISSVVASKARPLNEPYCAAKAGVEALTRVLALELAEHGINVNCVAPGHIKTPLTKPMFTESIQRAFEARIPLGKLGEPEWIAQVVAFLASDEASYMTGQVVTVDGGFNMSGDLPGLAFGPTANEL